ncbi:MAG: hypothetical protein WCA35_02020 [Kovacikia sp.]
MRTFDLRTIVESPVFSVLVLVTFGLLVAVSGGVGYLTLAEWRDRRRREEETRTNRPSRPAQRTPSKTKK